MIISKQLHCNYNYFEKQKRSFLAADIGYTLIASEYLNIFFQSPRTKTVRQQEKNLNREIYNFAWEKQDSTKRQSCFGSKAFDQSVLMESFLEDIFMVENILNFKLKSMIIYFHFPGLFSKIFPTGNAESFCNHIFRLFDSDGNNFLDFKEFLMALDIAQCTDERQKLEWSFRYLDKDLLYFVQSIK